MVVLGPPTPKKIHNHTLRGSWLQIAWQHTQVSIPPAAGEPIDHNPAWPASPAASTAVVPEAAAVTADNRPVDPNAIPNPAARVSPMASGADWLFAGAAFSGSGINGVVVVALGGNGGAFTGGALSVLLGGVLGRSVPFDFFSVPMAVAKAFAAAVVGT